MLGNYHKGFKCKCVPVLSLVSVFSLLALHVGLSFPDLFCRRWWKIFMKGILNSVRFMPARLLPASLSMSSLVLTIIGDVHSTEVDRQLRCLSGHLFLVVSGLHLHLFVVLRLLFPFKIPLLSFSRRF